MDKSAVPKDYRAGKEWNDPLRPQQPLIAGKWLIYAISIAGAAALICLYATLCLLFYQGSWQFIFHPSRTITTTPAVPYQAIQFDYTETGKPQLTGWWIPAETGARYSSKTILFLHDGHGSLSDIAAQLDSLHTLGINLFAIDYRGFGKSAALHPSEAGMNQDADAALAYLTGMRQLHPRSILLYGVGLSASIAASTAARHPNIPAVILENISPTALTLFAADARTKLLPVRLLTNDRFNSAESLKTLQTRKLFLARNNRPETQEVFSTAGTPKQIFNIGPTESTKYLETMRHFLDEVLSHQ